MKTTVTISISTLNLFDIHKLTITPSVVVNPPAVQYFKGVEHDWINGNWKNTDNRFPQMKDHTITMLSSDDYPNSPICSKKVAAKIADNVIPKLLKQIKPKSHDFEPFNITRSIKI